MGLYDREYMRDVPIYRRLTGRVEGAELPLPTPRQQRRRHGRISPITFIAVCLLAAAVGAAYLLRGQVSNSPVSAAVAPPKHRAMLVSPGVIPMKTAPVKRTGLIRGTRLLQYGSRMTIAGTAEPVPGSVQLLGRWNRGRWETFAVADASGHSYRFVVPLSERGRLDLKVVQPDGYASVGTYQVS